MNQTAIGIWALGRQEENEAVCGHFITQALLSNMISKLMLTSTVGIVHPYCRNAHSLSYLCKMRNTVYNLLLTARLKENSLYSFPEILHFSY